MRIDVDSKTGTRKIKLDKTEVKWLRAANVVLGQLAQLGINDELKTVVARLIDEGVLDGMGESSQSNTPV